MSRVSGADIVVEALAAAGVELVFGVPGSQNVALFEALRRSSLRPIVPTDEMAASFMAAGYARTTGGLAVLTTIPGPGFTFALSGLAEARADSAAVLYLALAVDHGGQPFALQRLDQPAIAGPFVKRVFVVDRLETLEDTIAEGAKLALAGEPGPVMVQLPTPLLAASIDRRPPVAVLSRGAAPVASRAAPAADLTAVGDRWRAARRPVLLLGQGGRAIGPAIVALAEAAIIPIVPTASGRGIVPEPHPLGFVRDFSFGAGAVVPRLLNDADLVIALGVKLSHNGTAGFTLPLDPARLIHLDPAATTLAASPARLTVEVGAEAVGPLLAALQHERYRTGWAEADLARRLEALAVERQDAIAFEPMLASGKPVAALFAALDAGLPDDRIVVTDSGLHQALTRGRIAVRRPAGLLVPADFQSMGFGIPAAIAAKLAAPAAAVVAVVGDGGMLMTATELVTARRLGLDLIVIVFNNGALGLIERQQLVRHGHVVGTRFENPDFAQLAGSFGIGYRDGTDEPVAALRDARAEGGVQLVEIRLGDQPGLARAAVKARARTVGLALGGAGLLGWLRRLRGTGRSGRAGPGGLGERG